LTKKVHPRQNPSYAYAHIVTCGDYRMHNCKNAMHDDPEVEAG